jgi:tetratricopeptide (TPR) repeat protein
MGTKEVMVTAPAMVLLYDRTFVGGSFREAWKRRRLFYVCLAGTWLLTVVLVVGNHGRGGTAGFASGMPWWAYGLTQFRAIAHYLRLSVWPDPLIFDYGRMLGGKSVGLAVDAAVIAGLAAVSVLLFLRRRPLGFLGIWYFAILLPSSSVVPVATEVIAEHRMYLSLAAVLAAIVGGVSALSGILRAALGLTSRGVAILGISACLAAAAVLGFATARRIDLYRSPRAIWADTVSKAPQNTGARNNLGIALAAEGDLTGAEAQYRAALALAPDLADVHNNLANVLAKKGLLSEAVANYQAALQFRLRDPGIHEDLGTALLRLGRLEEARGHFEEALRLDPESSVGHFDMGNLLDREGQLQAAASQYRETLRLDPGYSRAWYNLGNLFARTGRFAEAAEAYASAVRLRPDFADAHVNYGNVLTELDRTSEAIGEFQAALRLQPGAADVHDSLGGVLAKAGRWTEARIQFEEALRLDPGDREARANLERIDSAHGTRSGP